jgi:hypothetical protein
MGIIYKRRRIEVREGQGKMVKHSRLFYLPKDFSNATEIFLKLFWTVR